MYSVYSVVDGEEICIYDDWSDSPELRLIDPVLELERNSAGTFTFTLPPTNLAYGTYQLKTYSIVGYEPIPQEGNSESNQNEQNDDPDPYPQVPVRPILEEHVREVDLMERMVSHIIIYRDEEYVPESGVVAGLRRKNKFWEGRVIDETKDWFNCRQVTCEGAFAYFNDTLQKPTLFGGATGLSDKPIDILGYIVAYHNTKVDASRVISMSGDSSIGDGDLPEGSTADTKQFEIGYVTTMEAIQSLNERFGGVFRVFYEPIGTGANPTWQTKIGWYKKSDVYAHIHRNTPTELALQTIDFGRNLLDFKCKWDLSKLCTVAFPIGKQLDKSAADEVGEEISPVGLYIGDDAKGIYLLVGHDGYGDDGVVYMQNTNDTPFNVKDYMTQIYNVDADVDPVVYITCRVTEGIAAFCACRNVGFIGGTPYGSAQIGYAMAKPAAGSTFQDFIDYKLELPHGTKSIALCSYGDDVRMAVKKQKKYTEKTVTETNVGRVQGSSTTSNRLDYEMERDAEPDPETGEYGWHVKYYDGVKHVVTNPYNAQQHPTDTNYNMRCFDVSELDTNTKVYISTRAEVGSVLFAVYSVVSGSIDTPACSDQIYYLEATGTNSRFKELNAYEYTIPEGAKTIYVASYEGAGSGFATTCPKITYNRTVTETVTDPNHTSINYVTVEKATNNPDWHEEGSCYVVNQALLEKYGRFERALSFEECESPNVLCDKAVNYLKNTAYDEMSIDISAIDMRALGYRNVYYIDIDDNIHATSMVHGLDKVFPVTKLSIPLNKPDSMKVTLNETSHETMTNSTVKATQNIMENIKYTAENTLTRAKDEAASMIIEGSNGFVSLIKDQSGEFIKEIVISSTQDPHNSQDVWIFNNGGLGHFHDDGGHAYPIPAGVTTNLALTMNGAIVADRITSGLLHGIGIQGCNGLYKDEVIEGTSTWKDASTVYWNHTDEHCMELVNGRIRFWRVDSGGVVMHQNGTVEIDKKDVDPFAYIQATSYTGSGTETKDKILSITAPILAINANDIWISSSDAGIDGTVVFDEPNNRYYVINSDAALAGSGTPAGPYYLPKTTNPTSASDYDTVYIRDGVLVTSSGSDPTKGVVFRKGFAT